MKKRMFALTAVAVLILGLTVGVFATTQISNIRLSAYTDIVWSDAAQVIKMLEEGLSPEAAARVGTDDAGGNVLLADQTGKVLAATAAEREEKLLELPEIQEALALGKGRAERNGMVYAARYFEGQQLLVRFSQTDDAVFRDVWGLQASIWAILIMLVVLTLALAWRFSDITIAPLTELIQTAREYAQGDFSRKIVKARRKDLQTLSRALERMREQLISGNQELTDEKVKVEATLDAIESGVIAVDMEMNIIRCNMAAMHMLHIGTMSVGKNFLTLTQNIRLASMIRRAVDDLGNSPEETIPMEDRVLRVRVTKLKRYGRLAGAVLVADDITEYNRLLNIRTDFTASVTHELKTPLTSIRGFVETLQNGVDDPGHAKRFLDIIAGETERLTRLIDDILYLSELESKPEELPEQVDVTECAQSACELLQSKAEEKKIKLSLQGTRTGMATVSGTRDKMMQLLVNLISNGVRYTPMGGSVQVTVLTTGQEVILEVADTGIGIPQDAIPRLFERFYRVDKGRSRAQGGTGLGLAIAKHIVLSMGGEIGVTSRVGEGTAFRVTLPKA